MKIGFSLLALVLLGALTARESCAENADQNSHAESAAVSTSSEHSTTTSPSGGDAASVSETKSADDIDTRITVQPRHTGAKSGKAGEAKVKFTLPGLKNPHRRVFSLSGASNRTARNAVSAPVLQREGTERPSGEHSSVLSAPHFGAGSSGGVVGVGGNAGVAKLDPVPVLPGSSNTNSHEPTTLNRAINGTSVGRHSLVRAGIGGPSKTGGGLNGTAIRPTH